MKKGNVTFHILLCISSCLLLVFTLSANQAMRELYKIYNPTKERCRLTVNPEAPGVIQKYLEIACLIAGTKDVYAADMPQPDFLESLDPLLQQLIKEKNIGTLNITVPASYRLQQFGMEEVPIVIMYTPRGERNAFLLAKYQLESLLKVGVIEPDPYLFAHLVGYSDRDIEFYQVLKEFVWNQDEPTQEKIEQVGGGYEFYWWPKDLKNRFFAYQKTIWPRSQYAQEFKQAKKLGQAWLQDNKRSFAQELRGQIEKLVKQAKERFTPTTLQRLQIRLKALETRLEVLSDALELFAQEI